jgi:hypothetical protein
VVVADRVVCVFVFGRVQFTLLDLACTGDDVVTVRAGDTVAASVIWSSCELPADNLPAVVWDAASGSKRLFVSFTSNRFRESGFGRGWSATVQTSTSQPAAVAVPACPGPLPIAVTTTAGTLTDGSGANNYGNGWNCSWLLTASTPGARVSLTFTALTMESFSGNVNACPDWCVAPLAYSCLRCTFVYVPVLS